MSYLGNPIDPIGLSPRYDMAGQTLVASQYRLAGAVYGNSLDSNFWTAATSGTGASAGVANAVASVASVEPWNTKLHSKRG